MKKILALLLVLAVTTGAFPMLICNALEQENPAVNQIFSFEAKEGIYAHGLLDSEDADAWISWQSEHDLHFEEINPSVKYFFLPTSADETKVDIYNGFKAPLTLNGIEIGTGEIKTVEYEINKEY